MMKITFLGGTETVTGSKYLIETNSTTVLIDCGLYQGYKNLRERNRQELPFDISKLDAIFLTHAHLDHSGYIPVLYKQGYRGPIYTHHATKELCKVLLMDSGHIQEADTRFYKKYKLSKHIDPQPLYDSATAEKTMELFKSVDYSETFSIGDIKAHLQSAGHILGAASIILEAEGKTIGFSGDVGRSDDVFMKPPEPLPELDLLLLESTYGNRRHEDSDPFTQLADIIKETIKDGGVLLIPSFAVGRAQSLQHILATLMKEDGIPRLPIYLDSPMAISVSDIYSRYQHETRLDKQDFDKMSAATTYTRDVEESKAITTQQYPHIIIAGSGMATGGRILHHFKRLLSNHRTRVLFTGYQAGGTRGAKMIDGVDHVKIHGQWIRIKAKVEVMNGLSGHADYVDLMNWLKQSSLRSTMPIQLVHGDPNALEAMRDHLRQNTLYDVKIATYKSTITL